MGAVPRPCATQSPPTEGRVGLDAGKSAPAGKRVGGGGEVNTGLLSMLSGQARMTPRSHTLPPGSPAKKTPLEGPRPLNKPSVINSINSEG